MLVLYFTRFVNSDKFTHQRKASCLIHLPSRPVSPKIIFPSAFDGHSMDASSHAITAYLQANVVSNLVGPGPSHNRACAIYEHGSSHGQFTEKANRLTLIRGFGSNVINLKDWFVVQTAFSLRSLVVTRIFSSRPHRLHCFGDCFQQIGDDCHNGFSGALQEDNDCIPHR